MRKVNKENNLVLRFVETRYEMDTDTYFFNLCVSWYTIFSYKLLQNCHDKILFFVCYCVYV